MCLFILSWIFFSGRSGISAWKILQRPSHELKRYPGRCGQWLAGALVCCCIIYLFIKAKTLLPKKSIINLKTNNIIKPAKRGCLWFSKLLKWNKQFFWLHYYHFRVYFCAKPKMTRSDESKYFTITINIYFTYEPLQ